MSASLKALKDGHWSDFSANKMPKCPHCGSDFDIDDNEAWHLYDDNNSHEVECPPCELGFQVCSSAAWYFSTDEQEQAE